MVHILVVVITGMVTGLIQQHLDQAQDLWVLTLSQDITIIGQLMMY